MFRGFALLLAPAIAFGGWDAGAAAKYLDGRAAQWAAWKPAAREGGPCISCHTSLGYALARPMLRSKLGEAAPTPFETGLIAGARVRAGSAVQKPIDPAKDNTPLVMTALTLSLDDARCGAELKPQTEEALKAMWAAQKREGPQRGAWGWTNAHLEPWEVEESPFFGAVLAAVAVGNAPGGYASRPNVQTNIAEMRAFLSADREKQPLANRLALLWAGAHMEGLVSNAERGRILDAAWKTQNKDGGWTLEALGPWRHRDGAPEIAAGSNAYATAWAMFMLERAGVSTKDRKMRRGLAWLAAHQNPEGYWDAASMNKKYPEGEMPRLFMRDATTAFAVMALEVNSFEPEKDAR